MDTRHAESAQSARAGGLHYVTEGGPGITRKRAGKHFSYYDSHGEKIVDEDELKRLRALAIPPAYKEVWICPDPKGHLQATGRDARGRKQYRYHTHWREIRDDDKHHRMISFAKALPRIRKQVDEDLGERKLSRTKVIASVVRLLEATLIRVGNEEYARDNKSYGLTTMRNRHLNVHGSAIEFKFKGKSGKVHNVTLRDQRLARIVKKLQELPGQKLFEYLDEDGEVHGIGSSDVNEYLREISQEQITAKDFRTWYGTVLAAIALQEMETVDTKAATKKNILRAIEQVAQRLGNTPAVCRKSYIHPAVFEAYEQGTLPPIVRDQAIDEATDELKHDLDTLPPEEAAVLAFLVKRLEADAKTKKPANRRKRRRRP